VRRCATRTTWRWGSALLIATSCGLLSGCLTLDVPARFLVVEKRSSEIRAMSPDEARIWVREFTDENRGDLEFWSEALREEFVENRGYTALEEEATTDAAGRAGRVLVYEATLEGAPHRYLCALFVVPGWWSNTIRVVEFVAPKPLFDGYVADVKSSLGSLGP